MRMLEIGCGNLRAGRLFIDYLDPGNYYGLDISPDILLAAQDTMAEFGLQAKLPHLTLVKDLRLGFLPDGLFDFVHAHSVFSHSPIEVIDECLATSAGSWRPAGSSTSPSTGPRAPSTTSCARTSTTGPRRWSPSPPQHGLQADVHGDWEQTGHEQSKIRVHSPGIAAGDTLRRVPRPDW